MSLIYKILDRAAWRQAQARGLFEGSALDLADGYIHFSTAAQAQDTARRHFHGQQDLVLLTVDAATMGETLKWEPSRGGALFPHLYEPLALERVIAVADLSLGADGAPILEDLGA